MMKNPSTCNCHTEPKCEPGYRFLQVGETIKEGDEVDDFHTGVWKPVSLSIGGKIRAGTTSYFRRKLTNAERYTAAAAKVDPGAGYRIVGAEEILQEGDEFQTCNGWGYRTNNVGRAASGGEWTSCIYRRKVEPTPAPGYRFLEVGEEIKRGDDIWTGGAWEECVLEGQNVLHAIVRRKLTKEELYTHKAATVDPGEGYRLLAADEWTQAGDEWLNDDGVWCSGYAPEDSTGFVSHICRRKLPTPAIEPGEGYRLLGPDEVIEQGDEYYAGGWGSKCQDTVGSTPREAAEEYDILFRAGCHVRRKIVIVPETNLPAEPTVEPGEGYRMLREGELIESTDEFLWHGHEWRVTGSAGDSYGYPDDADGHLPHRRKNEVQKVTPAIDPGEGYRLLGPDEVIEDGDQYYSPTRSKWIVTESAGDTVAKVNEIPPILAYRRRTGPHPVETCGCFLCESAKEPTREVEAYPGELAKLRSALTQIASLVHASNPVLRMVAGTALKKE